MGISAGINKEARRRVYRRDNFQCILCGDSRRLQIHHIVSRGQGGPQENEMNLVTLCPRCHALAHGADIDGLTKHFPEQFSVEAVEQSIVEYISDLYAEQGQIWNPWSSEKIRRVGL